MPIKKFKKINEKKTPAKVISKNVGIMPLGERILIKPLSREDLVTATSFGIVIPETIDKEKPEQGIVEAVGEGKFVDGKLIAPRVKVGDKVIFSRYGYDEVKVAGVEYYILKEENILAVLKK
jgi:chaperonin GroES